jgi:hypothetical protein
MSVRLPLLFILFVCFALTLYGWAAAQASKSDQKSTRPTSKLARPPKWDRAVLETFFTDARERLGPSPVPGQTAAATALAADATPSATSAIPLPPATAQGAPSGSHWSRLISATSVEDEVKAQVQPLSAVVQTPTGFKGGGYKTAREDFSLLAVLFGVIGQYDGEVRWQKDAANLRTLFARAGFNCKVGTDNSFNEAKARSQDLTELVRGGTIEARPAENDFTWPEVVNRPPLMKRMERSLRERLGPWTGGRADFTKNREAVIHEAQLLAVLTQVIKSEGYEYADDSTYREYVDQLQRQCLDLIEAAKNGELPAAQSAASQLNKTCDACHGDFRS